VYGYRHPVTKVWRYIGKGCGVRSEKHLDCAKSTKTDSHFVNWIRVLLREGLAPEIIVIRKGMSNEHAYAYEKELIARIGRTCDGGTLYNLLDKGGLGGKHSEESRRKMSVARRANHSPGMRDKKHAKETKRKQSESMKSKNLGKPAWNKGLPSPVKGKPSPLRGVAVTEEARRRRSESMKAVWARKKQAA
jgi:hypothetical protein